MGVLFNKRVMACVIASLILTGCASKGHRIKEIPGGGAVPTEEPLSRSGNPKTYKVLGKNYTLRDTTKGYSEVGVASWYGKDFHGKATSSGTPYNMHAYSAAHKTLPIPSYVNVTNLENGKSLILRVDDRGPFVKNRIIDLSFRAAKELGVLQNGTAKVRVTAIPPHQSLTNKSAVYPSTHSKPLPNNVLSGHNYYLQVGAFGDEQNAVNFKNSLQYHGLNDAKIVPNKGLYRVIIGQYQNYNAAKEASYRLGLPNTVITI